MPGKKVLAPILCLVAFSMMASAEDVSLSKDLMPIFRRSCVGCHQREGGNQEAIEHKVYFEKASDITAQIGKLIMAGEPDKSYLLMIVTPPENPGERKMLMPPRRSQAQKLSAEEIQKIKAWIQNGAKNN